MENLYIKLANEILIELGEIREREINYYDTVDTASYKNYGLTIFSKDFVKRKKNNPIVIYYEDVKVFDSQTGEYHKGIWEDIFTELHFKLPIIIKKREEERKEERKKAIHGQVLMELTILPLCNARIYDIDESLKIEVTSERTSRINNCGSYIYESHYRVIEDGKVVFHAVEGSFLNFDIYSYIPGPWELKLNFGLVGYKRKKEKEREEKGKEYIKQIRDIK